MGFNFCRDTKVSLLVQSCFSYKCNIEIEGTAYSMDRVPLPLKKVVQPPNGILSDEEILSKILKEVKIIMSQK